MEELTNYLKNCPTYTHWQTVGICHHHGFVVPLFSLRTKKSSGIGEFTDLILLIDWCKNLGIDVIQLLPLNETGKDPSPYNAISSCALNPIHIGLSSLPRVNENHKLVEKLKEFDIFNTYKKVAYLQLKRLKLDWLFEYYTFVFDDLKNDKDFETFLIQNPWLEEYALFRTLHNEYNALEWHLWPDEVKNISKEKFPKLIEKYHDKMHYYFALQYFCFIQLSKAKKHATENEILIEGDIPILISSNSCDVWYNREIFDMHHIAGAPPDSYSLYGQKWGFPIFNWDALKNEGFEWWKRRLNVILNLYHMYRIDHVVGFFRIWCMKPHEDAIEGKFLPKDPTKWDEKGRERLTMMLEGSPLLPIAEDLGLIPKIVYIALRDLGICGTKVVPWEKNLFGYIKYENYEPLSVSTISTHDSDTFQQWWEGYPKGSTRFAKFKKWKYSSNLTHAQRKEVLKDSHHTASLFHINLLQEYLALYPELIWDDPDDERINTPGTLDPSNWTYRYKHTLEEMMEYKNLAQDIKDIIS